MSDSRDPRPIKHAVRVLITIALLVVSFFTSTSQVWAAESSSVQSQTDQKSLEAQLFQALYSKDQAKALALIKAGANVNAQEKERYRLTLLHSAAENNLLLVVEALVKRGAKVNAEIEGFRGIPLTMAMSNGHEEVVRFLLDHGANAQYIDSAGYTLLHVAAGRVSNDMLQRLIDLGCDVNAKSKIDQRPLYGAIRREAWDNAKFLVEKGADIETVDGEGTPLALAAKYGGLELAKLMVEKGVDVRTRNPYSGRTALHEAALQGRKSIVEFLIDKGSDVNASGTPGDTRTYGQIVGTPILGPAYRGHFEVVKLLAAKGADLNFRGDRWRSPVSAAAFGGHREIVEWLVNHGAEVNPFDHDHELEANHMPLLSAVDRGDIEMVRFLLEKGARVNAKAKNQHKAWNEGEKTALSVARRIGRSDIADLLIAHGATE